MLRAEDLMIGDWVCNDFGESQKVVELRESGAMLSYNDVYPYEELEPIPLTSEILEKNGFTYCKSDGGFYLHTTISYGNWDVDVVLFDVTDEYRNNQLHISSPDDSYIAIHLMECNHVHELQHALRLCGINLEITV